MIHCLLVHIPIMEGKVVSSPKTQKKKRKKEEDFRNIDPFFFPVI